MEGVIRYRILGSHPAASGKFYTTGFSGESVLVQQLLDEVVREHQINLSAFKAVVTRVPSANAHGFANIRTEGGAGTDGFPGSGSNSGGSNSSNTNGGSGGPLVLYPRDRLHNYDSVAITVSKRALADDKEAVDQERQAALEDRLRAVDDPLDFTAFPLALRGLVDANTASTVTGNASGSGGSTHAHGSRGRGGGVSRGAAAGVDALALQRAIALAANVFPVRPGENSVSERQDDPESNHVCVLCGLPAFNELVTPCCRFSACRTCYESGQAMMIDDSECPVCGRSQQEIESGGNYATNRGRLGSGQQSISSSSAGVKNEKKGSWTRDPSASATLGGVSGSAGRQWQQQCRRSGGMLGTEDRKVRSRWESADGTGASAGSGAHTGRTMLSSNRSSSALADEAPSGDGGHGIEERRPQLGSSALHVETKLMALLGQALPMLDTAPDMLSVEAKQRRVKSAALVALDAADLAAAEEA